MLSRTRWNFLITYSAKRLESGKIFLIVWRFFIFSINESLYEQLVKFNLSAFLFEFDLHLISKGRKYNFSRTNEVFEDLVDMPIKLFPLRSESAALLASFSRKAGPVLFVFACLFSPAVYGQQTDAKDAPVIVQPGAPGEATKKLPDSTRAKLPPASKKDVEFMQGMIHHHAQAVEMVELMDVRTGNKKLLLLGSRIRQSQSDEINFMKRWLATRGEKTLPEVPKLDDMNMSGHSHHHQAHTLMPGMLTTAQMEALKNASGAEFDRLFLTGMIQHHKGALVMVEELFKTSGAGQDAEIFNFATDVDSGQRAEIKIMQTLLEDKP